MVLTPSTMLRLGAPAPGFSLPDTGGATVSLADLSPSRGLLVVFICNHCPFVKHIRSGLAEFGQDYRDSGLAMVAINSNDVATHPEDSPTRMKEEVESAGYVFPYLHDATQEVAKAFRAACTPDFFLFDADRKLVYRGQFDDSRPGNGIPVTGADLRRAATAVLEGKPIPEPQKPSIGCNIKWKSGMEPDYFAS